jgi:long-chain acyl-CoA synthetase
MIVGNIVLHNKNLYPNRIGIIDEDNRLTWKEVNDRVNQFSNALRGLGLNKGDAVALVSENNHVCVEFFFGVAKAGLVGTMVNYRLPLHQIQHIINDCGAKAILIQNKFTKMIDSIRPDLKAVEIFIGMGHGHGYRYDYEVLLSQNSCDEPKIEVDENDVVWIGYTSGMTGMPKGAIYTHRSRVENCIYHDFCSQLNPGQVGIIDVPLCAFAGFVTLGGLCFASATVVVVPFSPERFVKMVEREKVVFTIMHLARYKAIREYCISSGHKYDFSSLRKVAISGGEGVSREQIAEMLDFFGAPVSRKIYGGTEFGSVTFLTFEDISAGLAPDATDQQKRRLDSVGKPLMDSRVKIVDENNHEVPVGHQGEILLKGPCMMSGYLNLPGLTKEAFRGEPGWYYTKDIGMFDEDGYLYLFGRKDFMVKTGGFNVFPGEVESAALTHPAIAEAAMFGVPDERWVNTVNLAVVLKPRYKVSEEEIMEHCRKRLAGYQTPKVVYLMDKLPTDPSSSKVMRMELRKMVEKKPI